MCFQCQDTSQTQCFPIQRYLRILGVFDKVFRLNERNRHLGMFSCFCLLFENNAMIRCYLQSTTTLFGQLKALFLPLRTPQRASKLLRSTSSNASICSYPPVLWVALSLVMFLEVPSFPKRILAISWASSRLMPRRGT